MLRRRSVSELAMPFFEDHLLPDLSVIGRPTCAVVDQKPLDRLRVEVASFRRLPGEKQVVRVVEELAPEHDLERRRESHLPATQNPLRQLSLQALLQYELRVPSPYLVS